MKQQTTNHFSDFRHLFNATDKRIFKDINKAWLRLEPENIKKIDRVLKKIDNKHLQTDLIKMELSLHQRYMNSNTFTAVAINEFTRKILKASELSNANKGLFLKPSYIKNLFEKPQPLGLFSLLNIDRVEDLPVGVDLRTALALTRYTEDLEWSRAYLKKIRRLKPTDLQVQPIIFTYFDRANNKQIIDSFNFKSKPWRMTHGKETGTILYFEKDTERLKTPLLLFTLVYLHYFFEIKGASFFIKNTLSTNPNQIGKKLDKMFTNKTILSGFTESNFYSENIFWESAINNFNKLLNNGTQINEYTIVDSVWNANFTNNIKPVDYHAKEMIWSNVLRELADANSSVFNKFIISKLDIDDVTLTKLLLKTSHKAR